MFNSYTRMLVLGAAVTVAIPQISLAQAQQTTPPQQGQPASPPQQAQPATPPQQSPPAQPPAAAQTQQQQQTVTSADVTDAELEQFAKSIEDVVEIQEEMEKQVAAVTDSAEVQRLKTEANQKMAEAIQSHGMEVQRYNTIARSITQDAELKQRLTQKIQELRQPA
jgi:hypothetical protein